MISELSRGLLASLFLVQAATATDWPQWRGPAQTGHVPAEAKLPATLPADLTPKWRIRVGFGFSSPVVADGKVFYADNQNDKETLHAVDAKTGKPIWSEVIDDTFQDKQGPPGPRCTPMVNDGHVYAQSHKGELQCRSVADGKLIWRLNYTETFDTEFIGETGTAQGASRHGNTGSPVAVGDHLIVLPGSKQGAAVACLDKATGKVIWKAGSDDAGYAPAIIATIHDVPQAVVFSASALLGLRLSDGEILWQEPIETRFSRHAATPIVLGDKVIVSSNQNGLMCYQVSKDGDAFKVAQLWANKRAAINFSSPVAVGDHLFGLGPKKDLQCVNLSDGEVAWSDDSFIRSSPGKAHSTFIVMGDHILALTDGGELLFYPAKADALNVKGRAQVCGATWSSPAYADGSLYVRDGVDRQGYLYRFDLIK